MNGRRSDRFVDEFDEDGTIEGVTITRPDDPEPAANA